MKTARPGFLLAMGFLVGLHSLVQAKEEAVLALNPVGYWPADDGAGEILGFRLEVEDAFDSLHF